LHDQSKSDASRSEAAQAIVAVADAHPEVRRPAIAALEQTLGDVANNSPDLNAGVIAALIDLGARDSIELIRETMSNGQVDETICGAIERIEFDLGYRDRPPEARSDRGRYDPIDDRYDEEPADDWGRNEWDGPIGTYHPVTEGDDRAKRNAKERARARRKLAKAAKKKNRKK
jgi:hypothetical protein